jgi:hypothetical protein
MQLFFAILIWCVKKIKFSNSGNFVCQAQTSFISNIIKKYKMISQTNLSLFLKLCSDDECDTMNSPLCVQQFSPSFLQRKKIHRLLQLFSTVTDFTRYSLLHGCFSCIIFYFGYSSKAWMQGKPLSSLTHFF